MTVQRVLTDIQLIWLAVSIVAGVRLLWPVVRDLTRELFTALVDPEADRFDDVDRLAREDSR